MTQYFARLAVLAAAFGLLLCLPARAAAQGTFTLTIHMSGTSSGRVGTVPGGNLCDVVGGSTNTCAYQIASGAAVHLSANGNPPGLFSGGTGPAATCGFSACSFTMSAAADINVNFSPGNGTTVSMTTTLTGTGKGTVGVENSRCQNIDPVQGAGCTTFFLQGTPVTIGAAGGPGSRFTSYSAGTNGAGVCTGTNAACTFTITGSATVTASFSAITTLAVTPSSAVKAVGGPGQNFTAMATYGDGVTEQVMPGMGAWVTVTSLPAVRFSLGAVGHGGFVYAIGGIQSSAPAATVTRYDPQGQSWSTRTPMSTPREGVGVAAIDSYIYAVGGNTTGSNPVSTLERYDPAANSWSTMTPLSAPRRFLAAAAAPNGKLYAVGGETVSGAVSTTVGTVEEYDPGTNTWTTKASMPTPRKQFGLVAIGNALFAVGGPTTALEIYNIDTNTWTTGAPMPQAAGAASAVAIDGVMYVMGGASPSAAYQYDPASNAWGNKSGMPTGRSELAAAAQGGIVYAIGGLTGTSTPAPSNKVETFFESLRWNSFQTGIARINQQGTATAVSPGTTDIRAWVGITMCSQCATFTAFASFPTDMALDSPANGSTFTAGSSINVTGWALNKGAPSGFGTGVDTVHVYAQPSSGSAIFLGVAAYGSSRPDIGAIFGSQFTNSGYSLATGTSLTAGSYTIQAYAHNALTNSFDALKLANILLTAPTTNPFISVDTPAPGATVTSAFEVGGWALDAGAPSGTGVDTVQFYVQLPGTGAPGVFIGNGSYGSARTDVAAIFGSRFTNSGYHFTITGLGPGSATLNVYARSTVTGGFTMLRSVPFTVSATALMSIDVPSAEQTITSSTFSVDGWSIDRNVESTAIPGSGVDQLHVYAYPNPGTTGGAPIFLGVAAVGVNRPDVGAIYGSRYNTSGYHLTVDRAAAGLAPGVYNIVVHSHSTVTGSFNNVALVRVTLQ